MYGTTRLAELFAHSPNEAACKWLEKGMWPATERECPKCGCVGSVRDVPRKLPLPSPYAECEKYCSLRTGTLMEHSHVPLRT